MVRLQHLQGRARAFHTDEAASPCIKLTRFDLLINPILLGALRAPQRADSDTTWKISAAYAVSPKTWRATPLPVFPPGFPTPSNPLHPRPIGRQGGM
jgi:hypothetical protein